MGAGASRAMYHCSSPSNQSSHLRCLLEFTTKRRKKLAGPKTTHCRADMVLKLKLQPGQMVLTAPGQERLPSPEWDPVGQCPPTPSMSSQERRGMVAGWHRKNRHITELNTHTGTLLPEHGRPVHGESRCLGKGPHPCQVWRKIRKMLERAAATKYS